MRRHCWLWFLTITASVILGYSSFTAGVQAQGIGGGDNCVLSCYPAQAIWLGGANYVYYTPDHAITQDIWHPPPTYAERKEMSEARDLYTLTQANDNLCPSRSHPKSVSALPDQYQSNGIRYTCKAVSEPTSP